MMPIEIVLHVAAILDELNIPYMIGGSFASSIYGFHRTTNDADFIIVFTREQVERFVEYFQREFYVSRELIDQGLQSGGAFNIIHLESSFKVDFFVLRGDQYSHSAFARRRLGQIDPEASIWTYLQSPEDTVLAKLGWYRQGGGISELQWRDVTGILRAQKGRLDLGYLRHWASQEGLAELLVRALREAGIET